MTILSRTSEQNLWDGTVIRSPGIAVYVKDINKSSTGFGKIRKEFTVEEITINKAPNGSECILNTPFQGLNSNKYNEYVEKYATSLFTVASIFRAGGRKVEKIIFQGFITDFRRVVNETDNSVQFILNDVCHRLSDVAVVMPTEGYSTGEIFGMLSAGFYNKKVWSNALEKYVTQTFWLNPDPWPRDKSGDKLADVDMSLYWQYNLIKPPEIKGQPLIQALVDLCASRRELIPFIKYTTKGIRTTALFTAAERGRKTFDLVIGTVGVYPVEHVIPNDIRSFSGTLSFQNTVDRIIAEGDVKKELSSFELKPYWTSEQQTAYFNSPGQRNKRKNRRVGKVWLAPKILLSSVKMPEDSETGTTLVDENTISVQYRFSKDEEWMAYTGKFKIVYRDIEEAVGVNDIDNIKTGEAKDKDISGPAAFVVLDHPFVINRFTKTENEDIKQGEYSVGWKSSNYAIPDLRIQAIAATDSGKPLYVDTGRVNSNMPYSRTRYYESNSLTPTDGGYVYYYDNEDKAVSTTWKPVLNSAIAQYILYQESKNIAERLSSPVREDQITLSYLDFGLELGMEWMNLYDTQETHLEEIGKVYIEQIKHTFGRTNSTTITMSQTLKQIYSGTLIGGNG